jgi:hypothetical protein
VAIGLFLAIGVVAVMCKNSKGVLPRGGTSSAVLSAACHASEVDGTKPVLWGEVVSMQINGVGRCCFVNHGAVVPVKGRWYA